MVVKKETLLVYVKALKRVSKREFLKDLLWASERVTSMVLMTVDLKDL